MDIGFSEAFCERSFIVFLAGKSLSCDCFYLFGLLRNFYDFSTNVLLQFTALEGEKNVLKVFFFFFRKDKKHCQKKKKCRNWIQRLTGLTAAIHGAIGLQYIRSISNVWQLLQCRNTLLTLDVLFLSYLKPGRRTDEIFKYLEAHIG